jgi:hypothetical protein
LCENVRFAKISCGRYKQRGSFKLAKQGISVTIYSGTPTHHENPKKIPEKSIQANKENKIL